MLAAERKIRIVEFVRQHRVASVAALALEFDVHEATIRRDLAEAEQEGLLKRTHGGVIVEQLTHNEPSFNERSNVQLEQKIRIGKMAASMVEDGDHIIIDSGTTTLHIAKQLIHRSNITVVTNDINIAAELRDAPGVKITVTGGDLYPSSFMLNGMFTDQVLRSLHVSKAFIGTPAIHPKHGLMHPEAQLVLAKQGMINAAQEVIVVADDTKIGKLSLHTVAPNSAIHSLITGKEVTEYDRKQFQDSGVNVIVV
ncbi:MULTISPECIES: DeoR/GlpR family DNA-binding transcription regulator [unclassified Paenibacillus]|jgi:DeoR/GlpR family transcriptional regulator of sugar metabolism|uniref:DeoR/GlpR family DNA-binding transcription regulator n=1 Tax=unclassified Paenibacillus TaxID=185978 RepID=UPI00278738CE|nr:MULTISPECIES: DeoR/GlpR family DNA-binding transcription regulator [unclassified Paenibacillus]MDF2645647.1 DeoR family transcriptional regulator [Paenibacillus sp.]MDQ0901338.1 DeoR family fructose operon transcriptional repressor [Paenibacillus sp. V4I7]MDQ0920163.1 DeoR family fructose operon transcriptional repressor [Paenibacillus sp. V4I5]